MGRVLTNNTSLAYAIESALGSLAAAVAASGYIDFTAIPLDTETVTLDGQAYTFEDAAIDAAYEVAIGASLSETLDNLVAAVNAGAGDGVTYGTGTVVAPDIFAYKGSGDRVYFVARVAGVDGNALTLATDVTGATESAGVLAGGAASAEGGVADWKLLEPNDIGSFGADITTTPRAPISKSRQRRKGKTTDLDSAADFDMDATIDAFEDFIEGFIFATAVHSDLTFRGSHIANGAYQLQGSYSDLSAGQAARLLNGAGVITLLAARGYSNAANNGLLELATAAAAGDSKLAVAGLTTEDAPSNAVIELAGLRTDDCTWDYDDADYAVLTSAADIADFSVFLTVGQHVHFGSPDANGDVQNAFTASAADDVYGYARVRSISGASVVFDKLSDALKFDGGVAKTTDIMFGRFVRNVDVDDAAYLERSFQFEATYENLQDPGPGDEYEYSKGNYCNEFTFELPLTDKATASPGFIGTDTDTPSSVRKAGADTPREPSGTDAFNTSSEIARLRIQELDEDGLTTDFKSITLTLNNQVSPEKVLGTLGGKYMNVGTFLVDMQATLLFTNSAVVAAIRNNTALQMDFILKNEDQAICFDLPRITLGGGAKSFPINESVTIAVTGEAYGDPAAEVTTSIGFSFIPIAP